MHRRSQKRRKKRNCRKLIIEQKKAMIEQQKAEHEAQQKVEEAMQISAGEQLTEAMEKVDEKVGLRLMIRNSGKGNENLRGYGQKQITGQR